VLPTSPPMCPGKQAEKITLKITKARCEGNN
jgi:hypothetical protein